MMESRLDYWENRYRKQGLKTVGCCSFSESQFQAKTGAVMDMIRPTLEPIFRGKTVLDFGCGWGRLSKMLFAFCHSVYGIDISPWAIRQAKNHSPGCDFRDYDGEYIPFGDGCFEGCLSWTVLQHVPPEQIGKTCGEISRVLGKDAHLVIYENVSTWCEDMTHVWFRRPKDYMMLFEQFRVERETIVKDFDGTGENHVLMVLRRGDGK